MCGIVGLFRKNPKLRPELGGYLGTMLTTLSDRGPDSAGFAVYGEVRPDRVKLTLRGNGTTDFNAIAGAVGRELGADVTIVQRDTHAVLSVSAACAAEARSQLEEIAPDVSIVGTGQRMEVYKEVGRPAGHGLFSHIDQNPRL